MSEGAAFIVRDILEGGGHPDRPLQEGTRRLAWKTGTSFGFRDAWAVGVTGRYTLGVWVGRPDGTPNPGFFGANVAAPLLHDLVSALPAEAMDTRPVPASVSVATTCWPLGLREEATPAGGCEVRRTGWVLDGTAPPTLPDRDRSTGLLRAGGPASLPRWPAALQPWIAHRAPRRGDAEGEAGTVLRITGLSEGARLVPVPGQPGVTATVQARGEGTAAATVHWLVDGQVVHHGRVGEPVQLRFSHDGRYRVTAMDGRGHHHALSVTVSGTGSLQ